MRGGKTLEILSPGKKIRNLRKKINLRQDQLTDDKITRSLVSMIESGKRNLNRKTAEIIAEKLNQYYKNLGKEITPQYLLESEESQAEKIIDSHLNSLAPIINNKRETDYNHVIEIFNKIFGLAKTWGLEAKLAEIRMMRGRYFYEVSKNNPALDDYFSALEYYLGASEARAVANIYIEAGKCYYNLLLFGQAIFYNQKALNMARDNKVPNGNDIHIKALYNLVECYIRTKKLDLAIQSIDDFKHLKGVKEELSDNITLMEANTYRELKNYEKAKKLYDKLMNKEAKLKTASKINLFVSLAAHNRELENYDEAFANIEQASEYIGDLKEVYLTEYLLKIANEYYLLNRPEKVSELLNEAEASRSQYTYTEIMADLKILLANNLASTGELDEAEKTLLELESSLEQLEIRLKLKEVYAAICEFYISHNALTKSKVYFEKIKDL